MFNKSLVGKLTLLSGLAFAVLLPMSASAAQDNFKCRASAMRLGLPSDEVVEPVVANPQDSPCATDNQTNLSYTNTLGISTGTLSAKTNGSETPLFAKTKIDGLSLANLLGLVNLKAKSIRASTNIAVGHDGKRCILRGHSTITALSAMGQDFPSLNTPLDMDVTLLGVTVGKLHFNATLGGMNPTMGNPDPNKIVQRAVWLEVTDPVLQGTLSDMIVGEATSGAKCG